MEASLRELFSNQPRTLHQRVQLLLRDPARRLPEATVGVEPEPVRRDVAQQRADPLGDLVRRLRLEGLDVDDAGAQLLVARKRSEEHTSELQSQSNLVCRLLLETKKNEPRSSADRSCSRAAPGSDPA